MDKNYTHIVLIVDRSGSMEQIREDAEGGINSFIREQKEAGGRATLTLVQFDSQNPYDVVHDARDLKEIQPNFKLVPRDWTPLYDAVGRGINKTGEFLTSLPEAKRPGLVAFVIATDGLENHSTEFTQKQIADMVKHQESKYSWSFTYIGANQDAVLVAKGIGIQAGKAATYSLDNARDAYTKTSGKLGLMRSMVSNGMSAFDASNSQEVMYSAQDRAELDSNLNGQVVSQNGPNVSAVIPAVNGGLVPAQNVPVLTQFVKTPAVK